MSAIKYSDAAEQVIDLVNTYSPLVRKIGLTDIVADNYKYLEREGLIVACVKVTKLSWYQSEVAHLVVRPEFRGQGFGRKMVTQACQEAKALKTRIAQCTIRCNNIASLGLFKAMGFQSSLEFIGPSGNSLLIWHRVL